MKRLVPIVVLFVVLGGGTWIELVRHQQRSVLSGFFENQPTHVASRIQGRVTRIRTSEGQPVRAGDVLVELEAVSLQRETSAAASSAEQARQRYLETRSGPRAEEIRRQAAVVAELTANVERLRNGPLPEEIAQARAAERNARARLAQAERGLTREERAQLQARLDAARAEERVAAADAARYAELYAQDEVSRQLYERKQADAKRTAAQRREAEEAARRARKGTPPEELEQARQSWLQATASLNLALRGSRAEDIQAAEARLEQARARLDELRAGSRLEEIAQAKAAATAARQSAQSAEARVAERVVRAPEAGVVERIPVSVGDLVNAGTPLVRLADPDDLWIRVYVPEARLAGVAVGDKAQLALDGVETTIAAHVESVAIRGEFTPANLQSPEERGKQVFAVRLRLDRPDPRVKAGMYATVKQLGAWTP